VTITCHCPYDGGLTADPNLREKLAGLNNAELFRTCAWLADDPTGGVSRRSRWQRDSGRTGTARPWPIS
jgi:hypothetical protein